MRGVRSKLLRMTIACACFVAGVCAGAVHRYVQYRRFVPQASQTTEVSVPLPRIPPPHKDTDDAYPDDLGITPFDIVSFIDQHPRADLSRLWQRLGITRDGDPMADFSFGNACSACEARSFQYNLDDDAAGETVLQIKQQLGEMYRYLIFKPTGNRNWKFLGHVDVWAKYPPSDPVVLVSNGRAWLILQRTAATGSGLGAWLDTVYEVSDTGVRPVVSYLAHVNQAGEMGFPSKEFTGRPASCEIKNGRAIVKVLYTVEYFGENVRLFAKQKTAVLIGWGRDGSSVVARESEITPHELETIYNIDSMGPEDFVNYNRSELRAIAAGNDSDKRSG